MRASKTGNGQRNYPVFQNYREALRHYEKCRPKTSDEGLLSSSPFLVKRPPSPADFKTHGRFDGGEVTIERLSDGTWGGSFGNSHSVKPAFEGVRNLHNHPGNISENAYSNLLDSMPSSWGKSKGDLSGINNKRHEIVSGPCGITRLFWLGGEFQMDPALRVLVMLKDGNVTVQDIDWNILNQEMALQFELGLAEERLTEEGTRIADKPRLKCWGIGNEEMAFHAFLSAFRNSRGSLDVENSFFVPKFPLYVLPSNVVIYCELNFVAWRHFARLFKHFGKNPTQLLSPYTSWGQIFTSQNALR